MKNMFKSITAIMLVVLVILVADTTVILAVSADDYAISPIGGTTTPDGDGGTTTPDGDGGATTPDGDGGATTPDGDGGATTPDGDGGTTTPDGDGGTTTPDGDGGATTPDGDGGTTTPDGDGGATTPDGDGGTTTPDGDGGATTPDGDGGTTTPDGDGGATTPDGDGGTTTPDGDGGTTTPDGDGGTTTPDGANDSEKTYSTTPKVIVQKYSVSKDTVRAGNTFSMNFDLYNTSTEQNVKNLIIKVIDESGTIIPVSGSSSSIYVGTIQKEEVKSVSISMKALSNAETKGYPITISLEYDGEDKQSYNATDTVSVYVIGTSTTEIEDDEPEYLTAPKVVLQSFEVDKNGATAGFVFDMTFGLYNTSTEQNIKNLVVKVTDESGTIIPVSGGSSTVYVGNINRKKTKTASLSMQVSSSAETKNYPLIITLEYEGDDKQAYTVTDTVTVYVKGTKATETEPVYSTTPKVVVETFVVDKNDISAGMEFGIGFVLFNTSTEQNVKNMVVKVTDESDTIIPKSGNSNTVYVGKINKEHRHSANFTMQVASSAETKDYSILVTLEYEGDDKQSYTVTDTVTVHVIGKKQTQTEQTYSTTPKVVVQGLTLSREKIKSGSTFDMSLTLYNTSIEQNIKNLVVKASDESGAIIPINGVSSTIYVGQIEKEKTQTATLSMQVLSTAESKSYPITITMEYEGDDKQTYTTTDTVTVSVTGNSSVTSSTVYSTTPKVVVQTFTVDQLPIVVGTPFEMSFKLYNTSTEQRIKNLMMKISDESGTIIPVSGASSTVYVGSIDMLKTQTAKFSMQALASAETKSYPITVTLEYEGDDKQTYTATDTIVVHINQLPKIKVEGPIIYDTPWLNQICASAISVFNIGRSDIYNCMISIEGEGLTLETSYFGGIVKQGATLEANFNIIPIDEGDVSGNILITYEDAAGKTYEQRCPISMFVNKDYISSDSQSNVTVDKGNDKNNSWIVVLVILLIVVALASAVIVAIKNSKKRKLSDL